MFNFVTIIQRFFEKFVMNSLLKKDEISYLEEYFVDFVDRFVEYYINIE